MKAITVVLPVCNTSRTASLLLLKEIIQALSLYLPDVLCPVAEGRRQSSHDKPQLLSVPPMTWGWLTAHCSQPLHLVVMDTTYQYLRLHAKYSMIWYLCSVYMFVHSTVFSAGWMWCFQQLWFVFVRGTLLQLRGKQNSIKFSLRQGWTLVRAAGVCVFSLAALVSRQHGGSFYCEQSDLGLK